MFSASFPAIFTHNPLFSSVEILLVFTVIFFLIYANTRTPETPLRHSQEKNLYLFLHAAWLGRQNLMPVFLPFLLLILGTFYYIDYRINALTFTIASWKTVHIMFALPMVWWILSVWRCSAFTRKKALIVIARSITVYVLIAYLLRVYMAIEYADFLFDCRLLALEYGDC